MNCAPEPGRRERSHEGVSGTATQASIGAPSLDPPSRTYVSAARTINAIFSIDPTTARHQITEVGSISQQVSTFIPLTFSKKDLPSSNNSYNDPIVETTRIADSNIQQVLIDPRSVANILFKSAFLQMGFKETYLLHKDLTILGFSGKRVQPLGFISVPVAFHDDN
ncbi:hypothetical protein AXF42_Ash008765 [Apostasia shenzhenica]|uniref:Uncharacterized protein n=1 Tax=Apostasia shenzhenica TaxID=1088818 RepID=A0A2I0ASF0_9ASPA|nr:hypothetical protein AXF42_Ash008765 [Apostasia shenzhenica]